MRAIFWLAAMLLAAGAGTLVLACAGDDDDDDRGSDFYCGKDLPCHNDYFECLVTCQTWDCVDEQCAPAYRECLSPDGCTLHFLDCLDAAGDDVDEIAKCNDGFGDCLVDYCEGNAECAEGCLTTFETCAAGCDPLDVGCYADCLAGQWDCVAGCYPN
jgi:hypothetical protein